MIPVLILAAGQSSRMRGADKLLQDVDGAPLLRRQAMMARATGHPVYVALPAGDDRRALALDGLDVDILSVSNAMKGMSATLRDAVALLPECAAFMVMLGDLVALETSDLNKIFAAHSAAPDCLVWRGATADGKPGHPIIFDATLRPAFAQLTGDNGGESIVKPLREQTKLVPLPGNRARFDLDTPEDWSAWRRDNLS